MKNFVTVVITTRNRADDLRHCLGSLAGQSIKLDELVVVDNLSNDETKEVVRLFAKVAKFPVRHVSQNKIGYPHVYNRGLKEAKGNWVAFIDDDCVAHPNWYKRIKFLTTNLPNVAAILGKSEEYNKNNILSLTKSLIDEIGKIGGIVGRRVVDHEVLDSKNIVYNKSFLDLHKIKFDTKLLNYAQGASEDCDLGMQIAKAKGKAIYDDEVRVWHKDPIGLHAFYRKAAFTLFNHLIYEKKWARFRSDYQTLRPLSKKINLFFVFSKKYDLSWAKQLLVLINLINSFFLVKVLRIYFRHKVNNIRIEQV